MEELIEYLYGIEIFYSKSSSIVELRKTRIIKETAKTIKVTEYISPYNSIRIYKDNPDLARTAKEAVEVFVRNSRARIANLAKAIKNIEKDINQVNRIKR